jgi:hypothetical protein
MGRKGLKQSKAEKSCESGSKEGDKGMLRTNSPGFTDSSLYRTLYKSCFVSFPPSDPATSTAPSSLNPANPLSSCHFPKYSTPILRMTSQAGTRARPQRAKLRAAAPVGGRKVRNDEGKVEKGGKGRNREEKGGKGRRREEKGGEGRTCRCLGTP